VTSASPFSLARFEYEHEHLYFLQRKIFARLENPKPVYLVGSRGTGKTTLLKALSWHERLSNASLNRQLRGRPFQARHIGIYLKLPEIQLALISKWVDALSDEARAVVFSHYLDLVWLEELLNALSDLIVAKQLDVDADRERGCVQRICEQFAVASSTGRSPFTLRELSRALHLRREDLELLAATDGSPKDAIRQLRIAHQVGGLGRDIAGRLGELCNSSLRQERGKNAWHFKVCMDEGECLDDFQQRVLNTMLRLSVAPLFFIVSFVRHPTDSTSTFIPNLTLQQADRELIPLDEISEQEFRELVEGVSTVRVCHALGDVEAIFDVYKTLGELDLNGLLKNILRESVSPKSKELLAAAQRLAQSPFFAVPIEREGKAEADEPKWPIYQAYLIEKLHIQLPKSEREPRWRRRKQDSAELRKKMVAAYLSICNDIGSAPRYASADVVLQASDNCVRDFLNQVDEIFQAANISLRQFLLSVVDPLVQDRAIKSASSKKYESLPIFGVNNPTETRALVDGLSKLTAILQRESRSSQHLKSTERGQFEVTLPNESSQSQQLLLRSIREAAEAGFLRLVNQEKNPVSFRVHTSLAAAYGFSYRGAYYPVRLDSHTVEGLRKIIEPRELEAYVKEIAAGVENLSSQSDLFREVRHE
jgi:hypothetical protein